MKIDNKKQLAFIIKADLMMNRGYFRKPFLRKIYEIFVPDFINKSCPESNRFIAGIPAKEKCINQGGWYQYLYKEEWCRRYTKCETLKKEMGLN